MDIEARARSRSPVQEESSRMEFGKTLMCRSEDSPGDQFAGFVGSLDVLELEFALGPRDVHCTKGVWAVNQRAKKNVEVNFRKLQAHEQKEFEEAMRSENL